MTLNDEWQAFKRGVAKGWREAAAADAGIEKEDSLFELYLSAPLGAGFLWWILSLIDKSLGLWWQDLYATTVLYTLLVIALAISEQLKKRKNRKKAQKLRSTFAVLVDDQLLTESADINIITFQHAIFQGLFLGIIGSSIGLSVLFICFFQGGISELVVRYIMGYAVATVVSMLLLIESRLQAERRTRMSRYYQAATSYYLDRSAEINARK